MVKGIVGMDLMNWYCLDLSKFPSLVEQTDLSLAVSSFHITLPLERNIHLIFTSRGNVEFDSQIHGVLIREALSLIFMFLSPYL